MCNSIVALVTAREPPLPVLTRLLCETDLLLTSALPDLGPSAVVRAGAMPDVFLREFMAFVVSAGAIAVAILAIAGFLWLLRRSGWEGALDLAGILERWIGPTREPRATVNVEYRDADGVLMDLGPFIHVML